MFRLDFSCQECNVNRLNQVINYIKKAWECEENNKYCSEFDNYYKSEDIAVDTVFYWDGKNQKEIQGLIDKNFKNGEELIAIINYPESEYEDFPFAAPECYRWKNICIGGFWILESYEFTQWKTSFVVVEDETELIKGNSLRER